MHSESGARRLHDEVGVPVDRVRVIPHPVFPGAVRYGDDGATLVFFGLIQGYKQLDHALAIARTLGVRLIVAGDASIELETLREQPGRRMAARATSRTSSWIRSWPRQRSRSSPTVPELDQSGALLRRALGSGTAVAAYDAGGIAEPVRRFGAGAVAPANDLAALTEGVDGCWRSRGARAARAGARCAAAELTWDASAAMHRRRVPGAARLMGWRRRGPFDRPRRTPACDLRRRAPQPARGVRAHAGEYRAAGRDDAEERYGSHVDAIDEAREALEDMHDGYAATLGGTAADEYTRAFTREVARRFPDLALELE